MDRTFHQRFSPQAFAAILLLAVCALWCFLVRTGVTPLIGLACMLVGAAGVDRSINTTYTFTADGQLVISARKIKGTLIVASHIVIEYGASHITYAQPSEPDGFIREIKRRQEQ